MAYETVKRNRFYNPDSGQIVSHASRNHYEDLHDFHIPLERMHNSNLHDWGIARGLEVSGTIGSTEIIVNPGVAIDSDGQLISLSNEGHADIGENPSEGESNEVDVPVPLSTKNHAGQTVCVTIQYSEILRTNEGVLGRLEQVPWVRLQQVQPNNTLDSKSIVLAIAVIDSEEIVTELKAVDGSHRRRLIGETIEELQIQRPIKEGDKVQHILSGKIGPGEGGGLKITVPDTQDNILFAREDGSNFANLGIRANVSIGMTNPVLNAKLDIQNGGLNIGGSGNLDAAIHVKASYGGFDRLLQMSPTGASKPGLNLLASRDANNNEQWWVWGVDKDNTWKIQPGIDFSGESGLSIDPSGTIRLFRKNAFQGHDSFLRVNQDNEFPSGTHFAHRANFAAGITTGNWWDVEPGWGNLLVQGKVGIGIQALSEKLEVDGNIKLHPNISFFRSATTNDGTSIGSIGARGPCPGPIVFEPEPIEFPRSSWIIVGEGDQAKALEFSIYRSSRSITAGNGWTVNANIKNFLIDHPLHPDTHELTHSTLEGPEIAVFYRGEGQLSNGEVIIKLPNYFEALTRKENRTVLLTPKFEEDGEVSVLAASDVKDGKFAVKMIDSKNPSQKFYWEVKAVRTDVDILQVERIKTQLSD